MTYQHQKCNTPIVILTTFTQSLLNEHNPTKKKKDIHLDKIYKYISYITNEHGYRKGIKAPSFMTYLEETQETMTITIYHQHNGETYAPHFSQEDLKHINSLYSDALHNFLQGQSNIITTTKTNTNYIIIQFVLQDTKTQRTMKPLKKVYPICKLKETLV